MDPTRFSFLSASRSSNTLASAVPTPHRRCETKSAKNMHVFAGQRAFSPSCIFRSVQKTLSDNTVAQALSENIAACYSTTICPTITHVVCHAPFYARRDYPVTAEAYDLIEECGRGVSATVCNVFTTSVPPTDGDLTCTNLTHTFPLLLDYSFYRFGAPLSKTQARLSPSKSLIWKP